MEYGQLFAAALGLLIVFDIVLQLVLAHQQNYVLRLLFSFINENSVISCRLPSFLLSDCSL